MPLRYLLLILFTIIPGGIGIVVFGYFALVDWDALQRTYNAFSRAVQANADLATLFAVESAQNVHRINLFAEGVWVLLSAILAAIGLHGVCSLPRRSRREL